MADVREAMPQVHSFTYAISIAGKPLEAAQIALIQKISLKLNSGRQKEESTSTEASTLTIDIADPDFLLIEEDFFVEEAVVILDIYFDGERLTPTFTSYISAIDADFPSEGIPVLTLTCLDGSRLMAKEKKKRTWQKKRRSDVAKEIGATYGFQVVVDDSAEILDTISQSDIHDFAFLEKMAGDEAEDYVVKLESNILYYIKEKVADQPEREFTWRNTPYNLLSFKPQINKEEKDSTIDKQDIKNDGTVDKGNSSNDTTSRDTEGSPVKSWAEFQKISHTAYKPSEE